jgi:lysine N6-hydroxylase
MKEFILAGQDALYKGINSNLLSTIYQQLYDRSLGAPGVQASLMPNCELVAVEKSPVKENQPPRPLSPFKLTCIFRHLETDKTFQQTTDALILATGYQETPPTFLHNVKDRINYCPSGKFDVSRDYSITTDKSVFVQNADLHSHGFAASDLSFGPYRNAVILNTILGYDHYRLEKQTTFQHFNPGSDYGQIGSHFIPRATAEQV